MEKTHRKDKTFGRNIMSENKISHQPYQMSFKNWGEPKGREKLVECGTRGSRLRGYKA